MVLNEFEWFDKLTTNGENSSLACPAKLYAKPGRKGEVKND